MNAMVTLTAEESKRLVAKAVVRMESVQKANTYGMIGFSLCTTCGYVIQELLGVKTVNPAAYCSGFIDGKGSSAVPKKKQEKLLLLEKGEPRWLDFPRENLTVVIDQMGPDDIIMKSGNMIDSEGSVGALVASPNGGEAGQYLPYVLAKGIRLIVPMTLNKTIPVRLKDIIPHLGIRRFQRERVHGMPCGLIPLPGQVITEIDAFHMLWGVKALPVAMGGVGSGAGAVTLLLQGEETAIEEAWHRVSQIKGEPVLENLM